MNKRVKTVESRGTLIVAQAEDLGELVRPPARLVRTSHSQLPNWQGLRLLELNVARPQGFFCRRRSVTSRATATICATLPYGSSTALR